jgi:N-acetylneuraminic acid mutarotase
MRKSQSFYRLTLAVILTILICGALQSFSGVESVSSAQTKLPSAAPPVKTVAASIGVWIKGGDLNTARLFHTSTLLNDGRVLVVGGIGPNPESNGDLSSVEIYNPASNSWAVFGNLHAARHGHTATLLTNGKVLVVGGTTATTTLSSVELYDPSANIWTNVASLLAGRSNHSAVLLQDGKVLVTGGNGAQDTRPVLSSAEIYDPSTNTWHAAASMNSLRTGHSSTLLPDGKVLLIGGFGSAMIASDRVERYNPTTNVWQSLNNLSIARKNHSVTLLPNGKVLVAGGFDDTFGELSLAELFDPATNVWTSTGSLNTRHSEHTSALLPNGKVIVVGGKDESSCELYDPATGTWTQTVGLRADRRGATGNLLANGTLLLTGGSLPDRSSPLTDLYNPSGVSNGSKIVFGSVRNNNNHDVFVMDADGNNQTRLTTSLAYDDQPKWSPDGSKIVFMSGRDGNFEIYSMNADGTAQTRLTNNPAADGFPAWSPDGTRIAFVTGNLNDPGTFDLCMMNADGSNRTQLTNDSNVDAVPAWSPDSSKLVFMSGSSIFDPNSFEIFVIDVNGSNRVRLTNNNVADGQPSFSPNGLKIVFASCDFMNPNAAEIFVMNADGSNRVPLMINDVTDGFPAWSSDGTQIIFSSGSVAFEPGVEFFVMNADGSHVSQLTNNSALDWFPNYKPGPPASTMQLNASSFSINEGGGSLTITVNRTDNVNSLASVDYRTGELGLTLNPCNQVTGRAAARCDYSETLGTLEFAAGETAKTFSIPIVDDAYAEGSESFSVLLSNPVNATLGPRFGALITITDNETTNGVNPLDDAGFFVRQHYLDFLNREPDPNGFNFWKNEITSCGNDAQCIEVKRINVSAAFFLSIEFQESANFVYRLYKGTLGRQPTYKEFVTDRAKIPTADGVTPNKNPLTIDFINRQEFLNKYPPFLLSANFIDPLLQNVRDTSGVDLTFMRSDLIQEFDACATGDPSLCRFRIVQRVVDVGAFRDAVFNESFVWMEYAGYLRRGPSDPPDSNLDGYNFWLAKLNQFNGNFVAAEMVKAFIVSGEYRQRFGP